MTNPEEPLNKIDVDWADEDCIKELLPELQNTVRYSQVASGGLAAWLASPEGQQAKANR